MKGQNVRCPQILNEEAWVILPSHLILLSLVDCRLYGIDVGVIQRNSSLPDLIAEQCFLTAARFVAGNDW